MSRRVLAVVMLVALVVVGRVVLVLRGGDPAATAPASASAPVIASPSPSATSSSSPSPSAAAPHARSVPVVAAAETWMRAWLNTTGGQPAWLARLQPITDGELYDGLALPGVAAAVPRGTVQPGAQVLAALGGVTSVRVPTTAGPMLVDLTQRGTSWVVVSIDRAGG